MTHKQKLKKAKKMLDNKEVRRGVSPFRGSQWSLKKKTNWEREFNKLKN